MNCRHCDQPLRLLFLDLGSAPPSNNYLNQSERTAAETWFPLRVLTCENCWLVQTEDFSRREELFRDDYAYFSSFSTTWLEHAKNFVAEMISRFGLSEHSHLVEVACNDGYLLQYVRERGIPCLGIEPTRSTAAAAREKGIAVLEAFFGLTLAQSLANEGRSADLIVANNVLAHVPDINDFVSGFPRLLKPSGVATFEFPHLVQLVEHGQFDTIYHEHYSYLSLTSVERIFGANGLSIFDVEELPTHGGSLRVFAQREDTRDHPVTPRVARILQKEHTLGVSTPEYYVGFQDRAENTKYGLLEFLLTAKRQGQAVAAYGAAAKGNTLLNFSGIRADLIQFVADRNPAKQNKLLPGSRIPVLSAEDLINRQPAYVLILPWNLREEITEQLGKVKTWGGRFVVAVPNLEIYS